MNIGNKIKYLRKSRNLTQKELADRAGVTKGFISQIERNMTSPSISSFLQILKALEIEPCEFFESYKISEYSIKKKNVEFKADDRCAVSNLFDYKNGEVKIEFYKLKKGAEVGINIEEANKIFIFILSGRAKIMGNKTEVKGSIFDIITISTLRNIKVRNTSKKSELTFQVIYSK